MLLAVKKFIAAVLLSIAGLFSAAAPVSPTPAVVEQNSPSAVPVSALPSAVETPSPHAASKPPAGFSLETLTSCLATGATSAKCLDRVLRDFLAGHSTAEALARLRQFEAEDAGFRLSCHPAVHAVGRETFRLKGTVHASFAACDQTCHSGCYHGAMERFLRGDQADDEEAGHISPEELRQKAASACDPKEPLRFRFQCLHGLGHALMFFSDYRLREALAACDALPDSWSRSSCYGGLFMENVFAADPAKRDLSATDYHYPCSSLPDGYRSDCYMMQTTRMTEMGLSTERLFEECRGAGAYQFTCMQSIGRDLSNDARVSDPRLVAAKCELGSGPEREACARGVAYALVDNTWDGRYAFPFCASFAGEADSHYCFIVSAAYLRQTFEKSPADLMSECQSRVPSVSACLAAASEA